MKLTVVPSYAEFPWEMFSDRDIIKMAAEAEALHDEPFKQACVGELKRRKPEEVQSDLPVQTDR